MGRIRSRAGGGGTALAFAATLALSGCALIGFKDPAPAPADAPAFASVSGPEKRPSMGADEDSLIQFYANVENDLRASGRLRLETAPADAPYTTEDLVRDFEKVALFNEYKDVDGRLVHAATPTKLHRWNEPIRVGVMTSGSVAPEAAARDRGNVAAFTHRLARLTGTDMAMAEGLEVNFLVLFMNSTEREAFADLVRGRYPTFAPAVVNAMRDTPLDTFCITYSFGQPEDPSVYSAVMILIRAEHPPLTRLSCVHEEMAQAMGLPNDSPDARPSLFSDSLEFALLTEHDEILLRMLYDPRLSPGMTAAEAAPLLPEIARDAMAAQRAAITPAVVAVN